MLCNTSRWIVVTAFLSGTFLRVEWKFLLTVICRWAGPNDRYTLIQPGMFLPSGSGSPQKGRRRWGSVAAAAAAKQTQQKYAPPLLVVKFITPEGILYVFKHPVTFMYHLPPIR
jgi:hypothetical protein